MSGHLEHVMDIEDDAGEDTVEDISSSTGANRVNSIMDMDYTLNDKDKKEEEVPEKKELPIASSQADPVKKKEAPEAEEEKEDKEEKEKKEEEKKVEAEKKKYKYKLDGKEIEEELSDEEVSAAISARGAINKRFGELGSQKTAVEREKATIAQDKERFTKEVDYVKNEMSQIKQSFEADINEFKQNGFVKGNPVKSVYNLLDKMGLDASQFEKAVFFHHLPETAKFLDMNDAERDAFLLGRENEWLKKSQNAVKQREQEAAQYKATLEKENSLKRQSGVSEELFSELKEELQSRFNLGNLTTDQVLEWNKVKPFYSRAESIASKVQGADTHKIARILLEFPETTDDWMLEQLGYKQQQEKKVVDALRDKIPPKPKATRTTDETEEDLEFFTQFRPRMHKSSANNRR